MKKLPGREVMTLRCREGIDRVEKVEVAPGKKIPFQPGQGGLMNLGSLLALDTNDQWIKEEQRAMSAETTAVRLNSLQLRHSEAKRQVYTDAATATTPMNTKGESLADSFKLFDVTD